MRQTSLQAAIAFGAFSALCAYVLAGDINPPAGPVNSTFKTMQEVEPRIAVNSVNTPGDASSLYIIAQPGSYYLTDNIVGMSGKHGIEIIADNVTLDLNGFELRGVVGSLNGIRMPDFRTRVCVRNGTISDWGLNGAELAVDAGLVETLRVGNNGNWGISLNATYGGRVSACTIFGNGSLVNSAGGGLAAGTGVVVEGCSVLGNSGIGIQVGEYSIVSQCAVWSTVGDAGVAQNGTGILSTGAGVVIESSTSSLNSGNGIDITAGAGLVRGCVGQNNSMSNVSSNLPSVVLHSVF